MDMNYGHFSPKLMNHVASVCYLIPALNAAPCTVSMKTRTKIDTATTKRNEKSKEFKTNA